MNEGLIDPLFYSAHFRSSFETKEACDEFNKQKYGEDTDHLLLMNIYPSHLYLDQKFLKGIKMFLICT